MTRFTSLPILACSVAVAVPLAGPLCAMTQDDLLQASLRPGWQMEGGHHMAGLELKLAPGWKTYWRRPGEAGIPPEFDWSRSENVGAVRVHWPSPALFHTNGIATVGYKGDVILPLEVVPKVAGEPVILRARIDMGICKDICMPAVVEVSATLAAPGADDGVDDGDIRAALKARPLRGDQAGVGRVACTVEPLADGVRLSATIEIAPRGGEEAVVFEPADAGLWVADSVTVRQGGALVSVTELVASGGAAFALDRSGLRLTVLGGDRAVEIEGCPAP